ncbi:MAG: T9SS C-terminal target domain-containing protein [Bacteroidetes bacterium]|nr:MAG: T9SS C-terminal target domain-containing protein [Bacteroidota bacterium]
MKKVILFAAVMFAANFSKAQWEPDVRLTNDPANTITSFNNARCVAASGDTVHIVLQDDRDGNDEIYYKRSIDGGITWDQEIRLTNDIANSWSPSISVTGTTVHVAWEDYRDGNSEIYYKSSADGGTTWEEDTRLTYAPSHSYIPSLTSSGSTVNVVWYDFRDFQFDIYYKRSTDGGLTWGPDVRLTYEPANSFMASIAVSGSDIHVVWTEYRDGNGEIYYKKSSDGGDNWGQDTRLTNDIALSNRSCVATYGSVVQVVWSDFRDGDYEIYYKRSEDGGTTWSADTRLTNSYGDSFYPSVAVSGSVVHVLWYDNRDGNQEVYYKRSEDGGITWGADTRLTDALGNSQYPSIALSGPVVHVVWTDLRDGNKEIYYKRDPTGGFSVGINDELDGNPNQQIGIYPNPACNVLNIEYLSLSDENFAVRIIDMMGRNVVVYNFITSKGSNHYPIDLNDYGNGLYFVEFMNNDQKYFRKIVISK